MTVSKCGVGFHGDTHRRQVLGVRLGSSLLEYQWYHKFKPIGQRKRFVLHDGDMFMMRKKASGTDWKRSSVPTLRHAAGSAKFLK